MHDSIAGLYQEYWENVEKKVYHNGFLMLTKHISKPCKKFGFHKEYALTSYEKKHQAARVYVELRGTQLLYWEAGHCDIDPGTVMRLKNSVEPKVIPIHSCQPGFREEERDPANQRTSFLCFSFHCPKEYYQLIVNQNGIPYCYQLDFLNYQQCARFFTSVQLATAESYWVQSLYSKSLLIQPKEPSTRSETQRRLISTLILEPCRENKLAQGYAKVVPLKRGKKRAGGQTCVVEVYADEFGKKLIGTMKQWNAVYLQIGSKDGMHRMTMQEVTWRKSGNKRNASKISLPETNLYVQLQSSNLADLVDLIDGIRQAGTAEFDEAELPESLPNDAKKLFLNPAECNIDILFHSKYEINRTFLTLFRASKPQTIPITGYATLQGNEYEVETREPSGASDKGAQAAEKKRRSRLSIYSLNTSKALNSEPVGGNASENRNSLVPSASGLPKSRSRLSMYFRDNSSVKLDTSHLFSGISGSMQNLKTESARPAETGQRKSPPTGSFNQSTLSPNNAPAGQRNPSSNGTSSATSPMLSMMHRASNYFPLASQVVQQPLSKQPDFYAQGPMLHAQSPMLGYYNVGHGAPAIQGNTSFHNGSGTQPVSQQAYFPIGNVIPPGYSSPALFPLNQFSYANPAFQPAPNSAWIQRNQFSLPTQTAPPFSGHPYYAY